jgi:hypothetical protein
VQLYANKSFCINHIGWLHGTNKSDAKNSSESDNDICYANDIYIIFNLLKVRVKNYYMKANKKYKKGLFDVTLDLCDIAGGANDQFLSMFFPHAKTLLGTFLHECPYTVISENYFFFFDNFFL